MNNLTRRALVAAGGSLAAGLPARKLLAANSGLLPARAIHPAPRPMAHPELSFTLADGTARSLADYAGKVDFDHGQFPKRANGLKQRGKS